MDRLINTIYKPSKICKINAGRFYTDVMLLSDIVDLEDTTVQKGIFTNKKPFDKHTSLMPYQE